MWRDAGARAGSREEQRRQEAQEDSHQALGDAAEGEREEAPPKEGMQRVWVFGHSQVHSPIRPPARTPLRSLLFSFLLPLPLLRSELSSLPPLYLSSFTLLPPSPSSLSARPRSLADVAHDVAVQARQRLSPPGMAARRHSLSRQRLQGPPPRGGDPDRRAHPVVSPAHRSGGEGKRAEGRHALFRQRLQGAGGRGGGHCTGVGPCSTISSSPL